MKTFTRYGALASAGLLCGLLLTACGGGSSGGDSSGSTSGSSNTSSSASSTSTAVAQTCPATSSTLYFCDDFQTGTADNWTLTPNGSDAAFAVVDATDVNGATTKALQYTAGTLSVSSTVANGVVALLKDAVWTSKVGSKGDYYVEMRIQPQTNSTTGNKQLYMIGRYQDNNNWNLGGLNVQNSTSSTQVEAGYTVSGAISRASQTKKAISNGTWYTVRMEIIGNVTTMYLDGDVIASYTDSTSGFTSGKIGLFTYNKSFLIDDVKVGDPSIKPTQLTLSTTNTYTAEAGSTPLAVTVTAKKTDSTADTFTVASSNSSVVSVSTSGSTVTLTPVATGSATIKFVSGSDPTVVKTITATIQPAYTDSTATYSLSGKVFPAVGATTVYPEDSLQLTFDSAPTIGTSGTIRIFKASDDTLVDKIQLSGESDSIGVKGSTVRGVSTTPIQISGNTVTITPHANALTSGTAYYVGISSTAFTGATLAGSTFAGIGKAAGWTFTVKSTTPATGLSSVTVAPPSNTTADFHTVQAALNYYMVNSSVSSPIINVKNGTYNELMYLYNRANVTILGESRAGVILQYNNYETLNSGSGSGAVGATSGGGRSVFMAENSDLLTLDTLTLKSTHTRASIYSNQAEVIYFRSSTATASSGHRLIARNANFYSEQDTLQLQGYAWFYNTKVSGNVDFIWGNNYVSLFEASTIEMLGDSQYPATVSGYANGTGGYILQARTYSGGKGFIFAGSSLTYADGPSGVHVATGTNASSYLARAASGTWVDNIVYLNCKMDTHINALGWASGVSGNPAPTPATPTATTGWREYNSMDISGATLSVSSRTANSKQLTAAEVSTAALGDYTQTTSYPSNTDRATIFSAIGWAPVP